MSKSFSLVNGDLALGPGRSFQIVSGRDKLAQDLKLWVLEKLGIDPATPTFGSDLDTYIGGLVSDEQVMKIRGSVINLIERYQTMQFEKMRTETIQYAGKNTLDQDEVVSQIVSVIAQSIGTTILIQAKISTLAGNQVKLTVPVPGDISA